MTISGLSVRRTRGAVALMYLVLSLLVCRTVQQYAGYNDIEFTAVPENVYTVTSGITILNCRAQGQSQSSGNTEDLDVVFFRGDALLGDKYNLPDRHRYLNTDGFTVTGLSLRPTLLSDNQVQFRCQVFINNQLVNVSSPTAMLTVADGRPPAVFLSLQSSTIQSATVQWSSLLLPSNGPVTGYKAYLYDSSGVSISVANVNQESLSYTYSGLTPDTVYQARVVAINQYGEGNSTLLFPFRTQQSLQAPSPSSMSFTTLSGVGNLRVHWEKPVITNYDTTFPITHYSLEYYSNPSDTTTKITENNSTLFIELTGLTLNQEYTFKLRSVNNGTGTPNVLTKTFVTVPYNGSTTTLVTPEPTTSTVHVVASSTSTAIALTTTTATSSSAFTSTTSSLPTNLLTTPTSSSTTQAASTSIQSTQTTPTSSSMSSSTSTTTSIVVSTSSETTSAIAQSSTHTLSFTNSVTSSATTQTSTAEVTVTSTILPQSGEASVNSNIIVLASAVIAAVIIVAIVIIAVILVGFCIYTTRHKDNVDLTDGPSPNWPERRPSNVKRWSSKDSSIKGSSLSGSVSSDQDLPSFPPTTNGVANLNYTNVPSDSPSSQRNDRDLSSIEEQPYYEEIEEPVDPVVTEV